MRITSKDRIPAPTAHLVQELREVALLLDRLPIDPQTQQRAYAARRTYAQICWAASARLEQLALCLEELTPAGARALEVFDDD